jgi:hypothetical protein
MRLMTSVVRLAVCGAVIGLTACGDDDGGYDMDAGDTDDEVALSSMIPDPVTIALGPTIGTIMIDFSSHPLDMDRQYELEMFLFSGDLGVTATNDATGVTHNLTEGTPTMTPPDQAGDYLVGASSDGKTVTVQFYNWFEGQMFAAGGDYSATISVSDNDFFETETFTRQVVVAE